MKSDFNVLLIGGSSGTGKSILARQLSEYFKIPLCEVDDIRIVMQKIADKDKYPKLFNFFNSGDCRSEMSVSDFVTKQVEVSNEVWIALKVLIEKHDYLNEKVIFEGDNILPVNTKELKSCKIKQVYIYDTEEEIYRNMLNRKRHNITEEDIKKDSEFSFAHGQEICRQ
jgi:2-phosphoglycerate kinase